MHGMAPRFLPVFRTGPLPARNDRYFNATKQVSTFLLIPYRNCYSRLRWAQSVSSQTGTIDLATLGWATAEEPN